jgi:hypothetical protein
MRPPYKPSPCQTPGSPDADKLSSLLPLPSCHHCLAQPCHPPHEAPGTAAALAPATATEGPAAAAAIATPADVTSLPPLGLLLLL